MQPMGSESGSRGGSKLPTMSARTGGCFCLLVITAIVFLSGNSLELIRSEMSNEPDDKNLVMSADSPVILREVFAHTTRPAAPNFYPPVEEKAEIPTQTTPVQVVQKTAKPEVKSEIKIQAKAAPKPPTTAAPKVAPKPAPKVAPKPAQPQSQPSNGKSSTSPSPNFDKQNQATLQEVTGRLEMWAALAKQAAPRFVEKPKTGPVQKGCTDKYVRMYGAGVGEASNHILTLANGLAVADSLTQLFDEKHENKVFYSSDAFLKFPPIYKKMEKGSKQEARYTLLVPAYITRDLAPFTLELLQSNYCIKFLQDGGVDDVLTREFLLRHKKRKDSKTATGEKPSPLSFEIGQGIVNKETKVTHPGLSFIENPAVKTGDVFISSSNLFYFGHQGANKEMSVDGELKILDQLLKGGFKSRRLKASKSGSKDSKGKDSKKSKPKEKELQKKTNSKTAAKPVSKPKGKSADKKDRDDDDDDGSDDSNTDDRGDESNARDSDDNFHEDDRALDYWGLPKVTSSKTPFSRGSDYLFIATGPKTVKHVAQIANGMFVGTKKEMGEDKNEILILSKGHFARYLIGTVTALWANINPDYQKLASYMANTYFQGKFHYSSVHKRQFEGACNSMLEQRSDFTRDFAALNTYKENGKVAALYKKGQKGEHPICTMDPTWVNALVRRKSAKNSAIYLATDAQGDDKAWLKIAANYVKPASGSGGSTTYKAVVGHQATKALVEKNMINPAVIDILMSSMAEGVFIGNPFSTFSLQIYILNMVEPNSKTLPLALDFDMYGEIHVEDGWKMKTGKNKKDSSKMSKYGTNPAESWVTRRIINKMLMEITSKITRRRLDPLSPMQPI